MITFLIVILIPCLLYAGHKLIHKAVFNSILKDATQRANRRFGE